MYDRYLAGKPGEKLTGLSQDAAPSSTRRFLRNTPVLPLPLWQIWFPGELWSQHLAGSDREGTQGFHMTSPSPSFLCPNALLIPTFSNWLLAVCASLAWIWQMNDSNEWLGPEGPSEMSRNCIPCAYSLHVGLTKAIVHYIQHGHISEVMSSKNSHEQSSKVAPIIVWHVKVQNFKSWGLLLVRWIKIAQKLFAAHHKLQHI